MHRPLSGSDVIHLWTIVDSACQSAKVAWIGDDGNVLYGTARHIVRSPEDFNFVPRDQDIRDAYLRITTRNGFEVAVSIARLMELVPEGGFVIYDW